MQTELPHVSFRLVHPHGLGCLFILIVFFSFRPLACFADLDSDGDGIPNSWETEYGLNPQDPRDASLDFDLSGFSNLERYRAGHPPGRDVIGYEDTGMLKPLANWTDDETLHYLDANAASGAFFPVVNYRYGTNQHGLDVVAQLKAVYADSLLSAQHSEQLPEGFCAALRWLHVLNPDRYTAAAFVTSSNAALSRVAFASLADCGLSDGDVRTLAAALHNLDSDRQSAVVTLLAASENPAARAFLTSPQLETSITNARLRALLEGTLASVTADTSATSASDKATLIEPVREGSQEPSFSMTTSPHVTQPALQRSASSTPATEETNQDIAPSGSRKTPHLFLLTFGAVIIIALAFVVAIAFKRKS
jgi:hypothetical protein